MVALDAKEKLHSITATKPDQEGKKVKLNSAHVGELNDKYVVTGNYLAIQHIGSLRNKWMHLKTLKLTPEQLKEDFRKDVRILGLCARVMEFKLEKMDLGKYYIAISEL